MVSRVVTLPMVTKLPGAERAVVEIGKLRDYVLSSGHPRGKHKARMFAATVGLAVEDAADLRQALLSAAVAREAAAGEGDEYGQRYLLNFVLETEVGVARVRSGWIVRVGEDFPRLTTCWVVQGSGWTGR